MSYKYLPIPPRVWSRVQNQCTYITPDSSYNATYIPLINKTLPPTEAIYLDKQLYKGNILQYKANSSRLTKNQKYAQISKGFGAGRTKVFATQSATYTNPNTTSLQRVNSVNIPFPNQIVGAPNNISGPYQYNVPNPNDCPTNSIQDGGNLVCNAYVNPCTGQIIKNVSQQQCFPSYCSDVPGQITDLCWNPRLQTWFPRNNLTNNNSGDKWPQNYKELVSAVKPDAPVLLSAVGGCGSVELDWSYVFNICIPVSSFHIYQDGKLVKIVPYTNPNTGSTVLDNLQYNTTYSFYIIAFSNSISSEPSNSITSTTLPLPTSPTNLTGTGECGIVSLTWIFGVGVCITNYNIYYANGIYIDSVPYTENYYTVPNLNFDTSYNFYVKTISNNFISPPSNTFAVKTKILNTPSISIYGYNTSAYSIMFTLAPQPSTGCTTTSYSYNVYYSTNQITYNYNNVPGTGDNQPQIYTFPNIIVNSDYTFYTTYVANNGNESLDSSSISLNTNMYPPSDLTAQPGSENTIILTWVPPSNTNFIVGYNIYDASTNGVVGYMPGATSTTYTVTDLSFNTFYSYYVKSYNNGLVSLTSSNIASATTNMLNTPTLSIVSNGYSNNPMSVTFTLTPGSTGSTTIPYSYNLYYSTDQITYKSIQIDGSNTNTSQNYVFSPLTPNSNYTFYATYVAKNGNESSASTPSVPVNTTLYPPTNVSGNPTCGTNGPNITLSWIKPTENYYYILNYYIYDSSGNYVTQASYTDSSAVISQNLNYSTNYSYYIKSYNNGYDSSASVPITTITTSSLNIPIVTSSTPIASPLGITFNLSPGTTGCQTSTYSYNLYYSINGGSYNRGASNISSPYTFSLNSNSSYNFQFTYVASNGNESSRSIPYPVNTTLTKPVITSTDVSGNTVNLSWTNSSTSFVVGYNIYDTSGNLYTKTALTPSSNSYTVTGLNYNTIYYFYVQSFNSGSFINSDPSSATTNILNTPTLSIVSNGYSNNPMGVTFTLTPGSTGIKTTDFSYNLYFSIDQITYDYIQILGTNQTSQNYFFSPLTPNSNYTFYATYVANNGNESAPSTSVPVNTTLYPPTNLTYTTSCGTSGSNIQLSWSQPTENYYYISNYYIYDSYGNYVTQTSYTDSSATIINLNYSTNYSYYIKSYNNVYDSSESEPITTTTSSLNIPTADYASTDASNLSVTFLLSPGIGCQTANSSYNSYYSNDGVTYYGPNTNIPNPYTFNLNPDLIYYFQFTYVANNGNESSRSIPYPVNTILTRPFITSTDVSGNGNTVNLKWTDPSAVFVVGYKIYVNGILKAQNAFTPPYSYSVTNLNYNTPYSFYVQSYNNASAIDSNITSATTYALNRPTLTIASYTTSPLLGVTFTLAPGSTGIKTIPYGYRLYYSSGGSYIYNSIDGSNNTSQNYFFSPLTPNSYYTFYDTYIAYNGNESLPSSPIVSVNTNIYPPTNLTANNITGTTVSLSWTIPSNTNFIVGYNIYDASTNLQIGTVSKASTTTYTVTGLNTNTSYSYYVKSYNNGSVSSSNSNTVTVKTLVYLQVGGTFYNNNGYTGILFDNTTSSSLSITFYTNLSVNVLAVGGGGGGGQYPTGGTHGGGGGGGGGVYYSSAFTMNKGTYNITVGKRGNGAGVNPATTPTSSTIGSLITASAGNNAVNLESVGGAGSNSSDNLGNNYSTLGGGGGTSFFSSIGTAVTIPNIVPTTQRYVTIPFTTSPINLYLSGGGGSAGRDINTSPGGGAGLGNGGALSGNTNQSGVNAINTFANNGGYGGGGGGTSGNGNPNFKGGNGGNGVVIIWFLTP